MTDKNIAALVDYRMEKSRESIKAARLMVNEKMLTFAMNRIYFAMFYAVQAALGKKAVSFSKHGQVKGYFNKEFIKSGVLPIDMGRLYNKAFEYRQKFDYVDFSVPEEDMVLEYIEKAEQFIISINDYLKS
ncbi:MAG: HEPN domain-containing protein [Thermodesulfobacteriota bacterium]|nr:HEPN domain-containing protein [Thermodesulfobacteriota bacterium]